MKVNSTQTPKQEKKQAFSQTTTTETKVKKIQTSPTIMKKEEEKVENSLLRRGKAKNSY